MKNNIITNAISSGIPDVSYNHSVDMEHIALQGAIEINREYKKRVAKMNKHFAKNVRGIHEFTYFNVKLDLDVPVGSEIVTVPAGLKLADGNTRAESYRLAKANNFSNGGYHPEHPVSVRIIDIYTAKQYLEEYYSIDNSAATETSPDILKGALGFLKLNLISSKAQAGTWGSALKAAYPGDPRDVPLWKVQYFHKELELLDQCGIFEPNANALQKGRAHLICASLLLAKLHSASTSNQTRVKLIKTLESLSRLDFTDLVTNDKKWNGVTALIYQVGTSGSAQDKNWIPAEYFGSTKGKSWDPVVGFYLHCLEKQMSDKLTNHTSGFRPTLWKNTLVETKELVESYHPTS
jgi:hypothetical protein